MKDTGMLRFLYETIPGRILLKLLVQPKVSQLAGKILSVRASKCLIPYYIKKHRIGMDDIEVPQGGFTSFQDFFARRRKGVVRSRDTGQLISPCDGFLTPVRIGRETVFEIKQTRYSLEDLLKSRSLAEKFTQGMALIFRLTPANYHRYCYAADGRVRKTEYIPGILHCVRPVALRNIPVFVQNSREYQVVETEQFGTIVHMEIGALLVGKIQNNGVAENQLVKAGEEKGYFEFGGSTVALLLQKDAVSFEKKLYKRRNRNGEIPVCMGEEIGKSI